MSGIRNTMIKAKSPASGRVVLFDGIGNECKDIAASGTVRDAVLSLSPALDTSRCVFIKEGREVGAGYKIKSGDIVFVRELPGGAVCGVILATVGIICAVASLGMGVYSAIMQQKANEEAQKAQRQAKAMSEQVKQLPFLKGAQNRTALGYNIPYVMGEMYCVPYKITSGCYRLANGGDTQEWLCAFVAGYAPLDVLNVKAGSETLYGQSVTAEADGSPNRMNITVFDGDKTVEAKVTFTTYTRQEWRSEPYHYTYTYRGYVKDGGTRYRDVAHYYTHIEYSMTAACSRAMTVRVPVDGVIREFTIPAGATSGKSGEWESNDTGAAHPNAVSGAASFSMPYKSIHDVEVRETGDFLNGNLSPLNTKVTATSYSDEIPHRWGDNTEWQKGLVKQLEQNTYKIDVCFMFDGFRRFDGKWKETHTILRFEWSNDGGNTWNFWRRWEPWGNFNKVFRQAFTFQFSAAQCFEKNLSVRFVRELAQEEKNGQDTCYLCYINCYQYDAAKSTAGRIVPCMPLELPWRDKVTRIGIRLESSDSTKDVLDEINCYVRGKARTWSKTGREWSTLKTFTRNSAAWILEILTSPCHDASRFDDSEIDLLSLGALYEHCEKMNFNCDGLVTEDTKKSDLLSQILSECGATMLMGADGKWTFAIEGKQEVPVALLNEESIVSSTASKDFSRKPFALKATYTNRDTWAMETCYMAVDTEGNERTGAENVFALRGGDKNKVITEASFKYATQWQHIAILMRRQLSKLRLQTREVTVKVGAEGDFYPLWSVVLLQTRQLLIGVSSGVIDSVTVNSGGEMILHTADICVFNSTADTMGIIVQTAGAGRVYLKAVTAGGLRTRSMFVTGGDINAITSIRRGDIYSFGELDANGEFGRVTNKMQITATKQSADGWELTLRDYSDALYETLGTIPEYISNTTSPRETSGSTGGKQESIKKPSEEEVNVKDIEKAAQAAREATALLVSGVRTEGGGALAPLPALSLEELVTMIDRARAECMDAIGLLRDALRI